MVYDVVVVVINSQSDKTINGLHINKIEECCGMNRELLKGFIISVILEVSTVIIIVELSKKLLGLF